MPSTKREEEEENDDDGVVVATPPTPIVVRHRFVNEDACTMKPFETPFGGRKTQEGSAARRKVTRRWNVHSFRGNPKRSDDCARNVQLAERNGKKFYVLAFAENEEDRELAKQGADAVGGEELIERIKMGILRIPNKVNVCATPMVQN